MDDSYAKTSLSATVTMSMIKKQVGITSNLGIITLLSVALSQRTFFSPQDRVYLGITHMRIA